jgi:hypothetical protein
MNQQQPMSNEQFALWVALKMPLHTRSYTEMAEEYYEWLESKRKDSEYDIFEAMKAKKLKNEG